MNYPHDGREPASGPYVPTHAEEHARCEQLGEGACVPVRCSCGETWNFLPDGTPDWSVMA